MRHTGHLKNYAGRLKPILAAVCLLPCVAHAWYPGGYPPPYPSYGPANYGYYPGAGYPGYQNWVQPYGYGYDEPRVYFRGGMDANGNYVFRMHAENVNMNDMYNAWLWFMYNQYQY